MPATIFTNAVPFSLLETKNAAPTKKQTGNTYAITPNSPKQRPLTFSPTKPPKPKLLKSITIHAANINKSTTSLRKGMSIFPFSLPAPFFPDFLFPAALAAI